MKLTTDKIFYIITITLIVFYMLWNHGQVEFMTNPGMNAAIMAGRQEENASNDLSAAQPGASKQAIIDYIDANGKEMTTKPYAFLRMFRKSNPTKDNVHTAIKLINDNKMDELKNLVNKL